MTSSKVERRDVLAVAVRWIPSLRYSIPAIQRFGSAASESGAAFANAKGVTLLIVSCIRLLDGNAMDST
jgi:hypothetical protein